MCRAQVSSTLADKVLTSPKQQTKVLMVKPVRLMRSRNWVTAARMLLMPKCRRTTQQHVLSMASKVL